MSFANPGMGNHSSVGKVVQFLQKCLTCFNSRAHGYERSGSCMISGYYGWMGIDINLIIYINITWDLGLFTKVVNQDAKNLNN